MLAVTRDCHGFSHGFTWGTGQGTDFCTLEKPVPSAQVPGYPRCYPSHLFFHITQPSNVTLPHHRQPTACHQPLSLPATTPSITRSASGGVCPSLPAQPPPSLEMRVEGFPPLSVCHHPLRRSKREQRGFTSITPLPSKMSASARFRWCCLFTPAPTPSSPSKTSVITCS